jgi:hypothetical protein
MLLLTGMLSMFSTSVLGQGSNSLRFEEVFTHSLGSDWCEQNRLTVVDVDRDGRSDIVALVTGLASPSGPPWEYVCRALLFRSSRDGGFEESVIAEFPGGYAYSAQAGDLNNDGSPDLILRASQKTHILLNNGRGNFHAGPTVPTGYYLSPPADANRDGFLDLISGTQTEAGGLIELFINDGTGTNFVKRWQSRLYAGNYYTVQSVLPVNLNGDDRIDLAAREIYGGRLITLFGSAATTAFVDSEVIGTGERTFSLASGRVNGDTLDDIACYAGSAQVFVAQTNGSLKKVWQSPDLGYAAFNLALADFDRDGFDDLFVGTFSDGLLRIYHNDAGAGFSSWWQGSIPGAGYSSAVADMNGDGWPDLILIEQDESSGISNLRVWINRCGPMRITRIEKADAGTVVTWISVPGKSYRLQFKERLDHAWNDVDGDVTALAPSASQTDPTATATATAQRFYRVLELP